MKQELNANIDNFNKKTNSLFKEFLAALAIHTLGQKRLEDIDDRALFSQCVGYNQHIEPVPLVFLKRFSKAYPVFIIEVFQNALLQLWNVLLNNIFCILIESHITKSRRFSELKTQKIEVDFDSEVDLLTQLKERCKKDYSFQEYSKRLKVVNNALNPKNEVPEELLNIWKHILIRNVIQHSEGIVNDYILNKLSCKEIVLQDGTGEKRNFKKGDKLILSIPDVYSFRSSIANVSRKWRI